MQGAPEKLGHERETRTDQGLRSPIHISHGSKPQSSGSIEDPPEQPHGLRLADNRIARQLLDRVQAYAKKQHTLSLICIIPVPELETALATLRLKSDVRFLEDRSRMK
jgi:hypothetical protein